MRLFMARDSRVDEGLALVTGEARRNLDLLESYWSSHGPRESEDELHSVQKIRYARELAFHPLPPFERDAYEKQRPVLERYIRGDRLRRLDGLYGDLKRLEEIQVELARLHAADSSRALAARREDRSRLRYDEFLRRSPILWFQAYHLVVRLLPARQGESR